MKKTGYNKRYNEARRVPMKGGMPVVHQQADLEQFVFGRVAPQAVPLEEAVLGALMLDRDAMAIVLDILRPESFYLDAHQLIFQAMRGLYDKSFPIDLLTVMEALKKSGDLGGVGGPAYLAELTNKVASAANIEYHARIIMQKSLSRQIINENCILLQKAYDDTCDSLELLDDFQNAAIEITNNIGGKEASHISSVAKRRMQAVMDMSRLKKGLQGISTGLVALDDILGGLHKGDLGILAGRPGMGKTSLALGIATEVAKVGKAVQIFSLEMIEDQLVDRQAAQEAEVEASKLRKGSINKEEAEAMVQAYEQLGELPIYIDDTACIELNELIAKAKKAKLKHDTQLILIDYIQQIEYHGKDAFNREQAVAIIAKRLKKLAKELDVPVIVLAQLSRAVETRGGTKRPQLSDLRESGQIEQEADWAAFVYRPEYYQIMEDEDGQSLKGVAEIIVAKNRHGELGDARVKWDGAYTRFSNFTDDNFEVVQEMFNQSQELPESKSMPTSDYVIRPSKLNDDEDIPF